MDALKRSNRSAFAFASADFCFWRAMAYTVFMEQKRSAGIIIKDDTILLIHRVNYGDEYYLFPGGGVEVGEDISEAAVREVKEETDLAVSCRKLAYHATSPEREEFFHVCDYQGGEPKLSSDSPESARMKDGGQYYNPEWIPLERLGVLVVYPLEIRDAVVHDAKNDFEEMREIILGT